MTKSEGSYVKVHFRLETEENWPPASVESLWAVDQGDGIARLDNIPWFVRGIASGDVVTTEPDDAGVRWAGQMVRRSENCTIRLIVLRDSGSEAARQSVLNAFNELGVSGEGIERFRMVALDVPPTTDLAKVQKLLNHGVAKEWWDMAEGCITALASRLRQLTLSTRPLAGPSLGRPRLLNSDQ
ncbi:DUF4265 domain-containing protein [Streptomyces sp. AJ-1]|nr:DUF4265 domain-containing protein [Streptomyces sp. AJ-1]MDI3347418.1 DUF4265 domain-containing protein [Streptomyces sp. AJ-1]